MQQKFRKALKFLFLNYKHIEFIVYDNGYTIGTTVVEPKIYGYSISGIKDALFDLLGNTGEEIIGIREGEKLNEVLLNREEIRYSWEYENMYMVLNPLSKNNIPIEQYENATKIDNMTEYSSDSVEKFSIDNMKKIILNSDLLPK